MSSRFLTGLATGKGRACTVLFGPSSLLNFVLDPALGFVAGPRRARIACRKDKGKDLRYTAFALSSAMSADFNCSPDIPYGYAPQSRRVSGRVGFIQSKEFQLDRN
jgi:hypothetical protein